jgi:hypothetical protein
MSLFVPNDLITELSTAGAAGYTDYPTDEVA